MEIVLKLYYAIRAKGKIAASGFIILVILVFGEGAQNQLFGDAAYGVAASLLPWQPIFLGRAALEAEFVLLDGSDSKGIAINMGRTSGEIANCPIGSKIGFSYRRSRSGWVAIFGITNLFGDGFNNKNVYPLEKELIAQKINGRELYRGGVGLITSAEGSELFVVVGADKPFDPLKEIVPALEKLERVSTMGGSGVLSAYDVAWSDNPVFGECYSKASQ